MALTGDERRAVLTYLSEPRTIQDIARLLGRSWVTAEKYMQQLRTETGTIGIKTFRQGTQGALKIVYLANPDPHEDEVKENLFHFIHAGRRKQDFDFLELYQFVPDDKKSAHIQQYDTNEDVAADLIAKTIANAEKSVLLFSGNLSFLNTKNKIMLQTLEDLIKRKVQVKILARINIASLGNLHLLLPLLKKYPHLIEIRHRFQPLRGSIVDEKIALFRTEETIDLYKEHELEKNTQIFYELYDSEWVVWLQKVFWNLYRASIDYELRVKELRNIV